MYANAMDHISSVELHGDVRKCMLMFMEFIMILCNSNSNNKINWGQNTWMKYLPPLINAKLKLDHPRINLFSSTVTE